MCHRGDGRFEMLVTGVRAHVARKLLDRWEEEVSGIEEVVGAMARFPDDAVSAEFLFDVLAGGLAGGLDTLGDKWPEDQPDAQGVLPKSPGMREVFLTLQKVAPTDLTARQSTTNCSSLPSPRAAYKYPSNRCSSLTCSEPRSKKTTGTTRILGHATTAFILRSSPRLGNNAGFPASRLV